MCSYSSSSAKEVITKSLGHLNLVVCDARKYLDDLRIGSGLIWEVSTVNIMTHIKYIDIGLLCLFTFNVALLAPALIH